MASEKTYTWEQAEQAARFIASRASGRDMDYIVAIERGGLPLGVMASHESGVPLRTVKYSKYDGRFADERVRRVGRVPMELKGNILLVDDVVDTGDTMSAAMEDIEDRTAVGDLLPMAMSTKEESGNRTVPVTNCYATDDPDTWVVFPWEQ